MGPEGFPLLGSFEETAVHAAEVTRSNDPEILGMQTLERLGIDAVHLGSVMLDAGMNNKGSNCNGNFAAFLGMESHSGFRDQVTKAVTKAIEKGEDPEEAAISLLGMFVKRDDEGKALHVGADELKKN
jgi:hypothetical protein